ncbi:prolyl oligopeptidase family serine peptidase [Hymenobacter elongatus]|uniref:prolyl oligopeptidase n=1 Tax=Hymenobacter elongatus TaxID=877208 RepID=A0A4Z0PFW4_9BACT|nr:prolyl oligopeptidase family serine peptidase [Hymenobacter elongatus]TGE13999.1 S9 family peptidase [Hymenobacter elongatus]
MKHVYLVFGAAILLAASVHAQQSQLVAPSLSATDTYFGVQVKDPYRNLEDLRDPAVQTWMKAQAAYARQTLDVIPGRQELLAQMQELETRKVVTITSLIITDNNRYFYLKKRPQDQQPKLYCRDGYNSPEVLLLDPESIEKGKAYTIGGVSPSYDGSKVGLVLSENGAGVGVMRVLNVQTKRLYPDKLALAWEAGKWLPDNSRFLYTPLSGADSPKPATGLNTRALLHQVGTLQSQDRAVFSAALCPQLAIRPTDYARAKMDRDTELLYGLLHNADGYLRAYWAPSAALLAPAINWKPLFTLAHKITGFVTDEQYIYFVTSQYTPRAQLMRMSATSPDIAAAELLVPGSPEEAIVDSQLKTTKDGLYFVRTHNGVEARLYFVAKGSKTVQQIKLPQPAGSLQLETKSARCSDLWVRLAGRTTDWRRYRYSAGGRQFMAEPLSTQVQYPEFADLVVEELLAPSSDGVLVPLSLVYTKNTPRNGTAPVLLLGYDAYSAGLNPLFYPPHLLWTQHGGVLAVAQVRGGKLVDGRYPGSQQTTMPTAWKDLIACAEYLTKNQYTSPGRVAISGGSAGGILIGRALTERPDLFAAAITEGGFLNATRWESWLGESIHGLESGAVHTEAAGRALLELDAYHHLVPGTKYPATLVTAHLNDPRELAWQSAKFAARLQSSTISGKPVLFFTDYEAGYGNVHSGPKRLDAIADLLAFGLWQTGVPAFQPQSTAAK